MVAYHKARWINIQLHVKIRVSIYLILVKIGMKFMKKSYFVVVLVLSVSLRMFKQTTAF